MIWRYILWHFHVPDRSVVPFIRGSFCEIKNYRYGRGHSRVPTGTGPPGSLSRPADPAPRRFRVDAVRPSIPLPVINYSLRTPCTGVHASRSRTIYFDDVCATKSNFHRDIYCRPAYVCRWTSYWLGFRTVVAKVAKCFLPSHPPCGPTPNHPRFIRPAVRNRDGPTAKVYRRIERQVRIDNRQKQNQGRGDRSSRSTHQSTEQLPKSRRT